MAQPAKRRAVYEDLYNIPENMTGEIIDGELYATPRPSRKHTYAVSSLSSRVIAPYTFGKEGGPGDWIIIIEPEIGLGKDILVPDLAGWKKERFPFEEESNWISVAPDWICEVLSAGTLRKDKIIKMPIYGRYKVKYFWLIDPQAKTLDVLRLEGGNWVVAGLFYENDKVRAQPLEETEIELAELWLEQQILSSTAQ